MRQEVYGDLDAGFHEAEMELIFSSAHATCFLGLGETGTAVAMLEVSLRNFVDGCLGGPVGYIEGIYVTRGQRKQGYGRELSEFAANWFRSRGCRDMAADAELTNVAAQDFLTRTGFDETYRIVEYKRSLNAMDAAEIQEIRELFDRAERESDPRRKHAALEEALDLLDALSEDEEALSQTDRSLVRNLRRSNTRRLLSQLMATRNVDFDVWFSYLSLLLFRLGPEVDALLKEEPAVRTAYDAFIGLWGSEAVEALENIRAKSRDGL